MKLPGFVKNSIAILVGLSLVVLLDLSLGLFGVDPLASEDSLAGFGSRSPLYIPVDSAAGGGQLYERNPAKLRYFNQQSFLVPKPAGTYRVVSFGGSTTYGRPYLDKTSFSNWFRELLARYGDNPQIETINAGGISYASYRVLRLMREMVRYQPDLLIVYSGHNEFLEARTFAAQIEESPVVRELRGFLHRSRIYTLLKRALDGAGGQHGPAEQELPGDEVAARLEQVGGPELYHRDPEFRANVIRQYREAIEAMIEMARSRNLPIILCTLPSNLSGLSPFKSEFRKNLSSEEWRHWQTAYERGVQAFDAGNQTLAVEAFLAAERIDDGYAELHYYKGQALERLGKMNESYQAYRKAKQEDVVPLRALDEFNDILRDVARQYRVPLADVEMFMRRVSPGGIPGSNLFVDHVHPTIEGQQLVAWVALESAVRAGLVPLSLDRWQANQVAAREYLRQRDRVVSPRYRAMGIWGVGRLYYWAGKYPEAYVSLREAWQTVKDVPEIPRKLGLLEVERGDGAAALKYFAAAESMEPGHPWALSGMANAYNLTGEADKALAVLERLPADRAQNPGYHSARGRALLILGRNDEGVAALQRALKLAPQVPENELELATALARVGDRGAAGQHYRNFLRLRRLPADQEVVEHWLKQVAQKERNRS